MRQRWDVSLIVPYKWHTEARQYIHLLSIINVFLDVNSTRNLKLAQLFDAFFLSWQSSGSFSFSDGPTVLVATASDPAETPTRAVSEPCLPVATSWDVNAVTGARSIAGDAVRDCAGDCTREDVGPLSGSSGPVGEAWVESVSLAERAGTGEEEAREAAESPVWELSSSSEENNDPSPTRSAMCTTQMPLIFHADQ